MKKVSSKAQNIADLRDMARRRLPRGLFEFVDRGSEDELTLNANRQAFENIRLYPRQLRDVANRSMVTSLFGTTQSMPICIAPTGAAGMLWHEGELAIARAAADADIPFSLSTASITSMERIAEASRGTLWFQLYMWPKKEMSFELVRRAKAAGYHALIVTIDGVVTANREYNRRNAFTIPMQLTPRNVADAVLHPRWALGVMGRYLATTGMPEFANYPTELRTSLRGSKGKILAPKNESITWDDLRSLREMWDRPLIVKGILHPHDATLALECGADAVIVSNHGGRNLDGAVTAMEALPGVVAAVGDRIPVLLDSGILRGADVIKALASGASSVLVGRAPLWGVAAAGEEGVATALSILRAETYRVMGYLGCNSIEEIDRRVFEVEAAPKPRETTVARTATSTFARDEAPTASIDHATA